MAHLHDHDHRDRAGSGGASANPVLVEVVRGAMAESRHLGAYAVVDVHGRIVESAGAIDRAVFARSAIKPVQALPLIETGAAEAFGLGDAEIALACASHNGEARHVETVTAWLSRIGLSVADLECGASLPASEDAQRALYAAGGRATATHDNCSGKHAGFLSVARHLGQPTSGYIRYDHPVQQRVIGVIEQMTGLDLTDAPRGTDGCGIPVLGIPLGNLALAMARLGHPHDQPKARREACARICRAMAAEPFMVAGTGRFCTRAIEALAGRALVKTGAEGVYCATIPDQRLGIAVKIDDGARRAAEFVTAHLLKRLGAMDETAAQLLADAIDPVIQSRAGQPVGTIRAAKGSGL
jgi:L-asparaginase II